MDGDAEQTRPPRISRYDLLRGKVPRKLAATGAGIVVSTLGIRQETQAIQEGVRTQDGHIFVIPSNHSQPPKVQDIPDNLDFVFQEFLFQNPLLPIENPSQALLAQTNAGDNPRIFSDEILQRFSLQNTQVVFGDVTLGIDPNGRLSNAVITENDSGTDASMDALLIGSSLVAVAKTLFPKRNEPDYEEPRDKSKRILLQIGTLIALWGATNYVGSAVGFLSGSRQAEAAADSFIRLFLHPEQYPIMLRSAMMALKTINTAQQINRGESLRAAMIVGAGHGDVQTFLQFGPDACRFFIGRLAQIPGIKEWLKGVVDANGGPVLFSRAYVLNVPDSLGNIQAGVQPSVQVIDDLQLSSMLQELLYK